MLLLHGSNVAVEQPKILVTNRMLDFGPGFYLTSDYDQAVRWARLQSLRREHGEATVTVFDFDEDCFSHLSALSFMNPERAWLEFVAQNRKGKYTGKHYDLVVGPVANDNTMPVVSDYMAGRIDVNTALLLLKPQKLKDQYAFLTSKALDFLSLKEINHA